MQPLGHAKADAAGTAGDEDGLFRIDLVHRELFPAPKERGRVASRGSKLKVQGSKREENRSRFKVQGSTKRKRLVGTGP
jgi:hypothetical protein